MRKHNDLISLGLLGEADLIFDTSSKEFKKASGEDIFFQDTVKPVKKEKKVVDFVKKKSPSIEFIIGEGLSASGKIERKKKIDIDELVNEVNKFDKEFEVKPKHRVKWRNPKDYLKTLVNKSDFVISTLIGLLNGVNLAEYAKAAFDNKMFTELSALDWNIDNSYDDKSLMFRCRYLTLILTKFLGNTKKIASKLNAKRYKVKNSENEANIYQISKIMNHLLIFVSSIINKMEYKNVILKINEYMSYLDKDADQVGCQKKVTNLVFNIREGMRYDVVAGRRFYDEDMAIDDILKLSYILSTNDDNFNHLPKFKHIKGASLKYDLSGLIAAYGHEIIKYNECYNPMFQAYLEAHGKIITDFYQIDDEELIIGLYALGFARFVLHMKETDKFINEMMKTGV